MDTGIGLDERLAQGGSGSLAGVLVIGVGNDPNGQGTGQFTHRVGTHAIRHQEHVSPGLPLLFVSGQQDGVVVLVMTAADSHVGQTGMLDIVEPCHTFTLPARRPRENPSLPSKARGSYLSVCYTAFRVLQRARSWSVERGAWSVKRGAWSVECEAWSVKREAWSVKPPLMLHAPRFTLHASRFTLHASRSTLHAPRSTLHAPRFTLHAPRFTLHAPRSTLHASRSTLHAPRSTHHASEAR